MAPKRRSYYEATTPPKSRFSYEAIRDAVPASKLLVWEVKEGWEPLCRFLNVDAPDTPFPRLNDAETFRQRFMS